MTSSEGETNLTAGDETGMGDGDESGADEIGVARVGVLVPPPAAATRRLVGEGGAGDAAVRVLVGTADLRVVVVVAVVEEEEEAPLGASDLVRARRGVVPPGAAFVEATVEAALEVDGREEEEEEDFFTEDELVIGTEDLRVRPGAAAAVVFVAEAVVVVAEGATDFRAALGVRATADAVPVDGRVRAGVGAVVVATGAVVDDETRVRVGVFGAAGVGVAVTVDVGAIEERVRVVGDGDGEDRRVFEAARVIAGLDDGDGGTTLAAEAAAVDNTLRTSFGVVAVDFLVEEEDGAGADEVDTVSDGFFVDAGFWVASSSSSELRVFG